MQDEQSWQQPELFDAVAKELFFSNKVLFVEGKEDVGLLSKFMRENNIPSDYLFFGYGVGGASKMYHYLCLARDIGLQKVSAILDHGADEKKIFNKCKEAFPFI
jgi:predicted ATP-dependent endonuclease of OLD family